MYSSKLRHLVCFGKHVFPFKSPASLVRAACVRCLSSEVSHVDTEGEAQKPVTNEPFVKNMLLGKFDTNMLVFPEVLSKEECEDLNQMVQPIEKFFLEDLDSKGIDQNAKIPDDVLQTVKDLGLFGQQVPQEHGGLGLNATQYARLAEITAHDGSIAVTLGAHQSIGLKGILIAGTEAQKAQYLPKLATGEHVAAFCLTEPGSGSDAASIQTRATLSEDKKHFLLNGNKIWISNGATADIFTVFAKTEVLDDFGKKSDKVSAFIVERAFGGVTNGKPEDKLGIRGSITTEVTFDNTPVPVENVLEGVGKGFKVAMNILNSGRFSMGSSGAGVLKHLIGLTAEHAIARKQFGKPLKDFGLIQEKFAKLAMNAYAMESMAYLTAGILDSYQIPDASVEAAIVKVFASESCWECISECLQILGGLGYMKDYPYERYLRDTRIMLIFEGTNEILRLYIALTGFQHAGMQLRELIKKLKDPMNNVGLVWKNAMSRVAGKKPKLNLYQHLHPDLHVSAQELEQRIIGLESLTEQYLSTHRDAIIDQQMSLKRFADLLIDAYAMTAVMARSSRSISIGLKNHDHEVLIARTFCYEACQRMDANMNALQIGSLVNGDESRARIADTIFKNHGWACAHSLDRNW